MRALRHGLACGVESRALRLLHHLLPALPARPRRSFILQRAVSGNPSNGASKPVEPEPQRRFDLELMGPDWINKARIPDAMLESVLALPGTKGMFDFRTRVDALGEWKSSLQKGTLPRMDTLTWPQDPFKTKFAEALVKLEMPRFTRRYPAVLNTLLAQMLALVTEFEEKLAEMEKNRKPESPRQQQTQSSMQQPNKQPPKNQQEKGGEQDGQAGAGGQDDQEMQISESDMQRAMEQAKKQAGKSGKEGKELHVKLQAEKGEAGKGKPSPADESLQQQMDQVAAQIVEGFRQKMAEVMENLQAGEAAFDDLSAMLQGSEGFDSSSGTWRSSGWRELNKLRKVLENCKELRDLVRKLGRGGGKGPLRRAPEQVEQRKAPAGVLLSPLQPEEVRGLTRSNDLSRMLPSEMALMAHGWPRKKRVAVSAGTAAAASSSSKATARTSAAAAVAPKRAGSSVPVQSVGSVDAARFGGVLPEPKAATPVPGDKDFFPSVDSEEYDLEEYYLPGAHTARMLHRVRRAERNLLSYERVGWLDDEPARTTSRYEVRPAAELGPIILCLDTSGSMSGARETVAKALALECMRGAHRQRRACYIYAFSGPADVQELALDVNVASLDKLLKFLSCSFNGGTDVDAPLKRSLDRLKQTAWSQADILLVTDGEIPNVNQDYIDQIKEMHEDKGLKVHGLLVSDHTSDAMKAVCTEIHVFKSWTSVGGR